MYYNDMRAHVTPYVTMTCVTWALYGPVQYKLIIDDLLTRLHSDVYFDVLSRLIRRAERPE